ncbi:MAG: hypothetical protein JNJ41_14940 [Bacteroidia bacterium]|nr:hypothetical protein [Bacteroidia bacterium]
MKYINLFIIALLVKNFLKMPGSLSIENQLITRNDSLNRICIPGISIGAISTTTSELDLIRIYGKENVKHSNIEVGEESFEKVTVLFSNKPDELKILWKDTVNFLTPLRIYIKAKNTNWKTNTGITTGTSLKKLELINTKPFILQGFGWDYSGFVSNWNNGTLEKDDSELKIRLSYNKKQKLTKFELIEIMGDKEIPSSNKIIQKLNLKVVELIFSFNNK